MMRHSGGTTLAPVFLPLCIALSAACAERADPDTDAAEDSVYTEPPPVGMRGYPGSDSTAPAPGAIGELGQGEKVAVTLTDGALRLSTDSIGAGSAAFVIENRGEATHRIEIRSQHAGRWNTVPIPPGSSVTMRMALTWADYEVVCLIEDVSGVHLENGERATIRVR